MAVVRGKFSVTRFETSMGSSARKHPDGSYVMENGRNVYDRKEMRTVVLHPVYSDDPNSENKKFWDASPSGEIRLGTVNPDAWRAFELDKEYYVDFTPVP